MEANRKSKAISRQNRGRLDENVAVNRNGAVIKYSLALARKGRSMVRLDRAIFCCILITQRKRLIRRKLIIICVENLPGCLHCESKVANRRTSFFIQKSILLP